MSGLVWSLADTHCVWCGKPFAESGRSFHDVCVHSGGKAKVARGLRALVEAQTAAYEQLRAAAFRYFHTKDNGSFAEWVKATAELRALLLGEVVRTEEAARDD